MRDLPVITDPRIVARGVRFTGRHACVNHRRYGAGVRPVLEARVTWPEDYEDGAPHAGTTETVVGFIRDGMFVPTG